MGPWVTYICNKLDVYGIYELAFFDSGIYELAGVRVLTLVNSY